MFKTPSSGSQLGQLIADRELERVELMRPGFVDRLRGASQATLSGELSDLQIQTSVRKHLERIMHVPNWNQADAHITRAEGKTVGDFKMAGNVESLSNFAIRDSWRYISLEHFTGAVMRDPELNTVITAISIEPGTRPESPDFLLQFSF